MTKNEAFEILSQSIKAITEEKITSRRRHHANSANKALSALRELLPPEGLAEATEDGYQKGLLKSIELAKRAREEHESHATKAQDSAGAAYVVMSGVRHYGQAINGTFESLVQAALMESIRTLRARST